MVEKKEKHIDGREATYMAVENDKRRPIVLEPAPDGSVDPAAESQVPVKTTTDSRTAPLRVLKPSRTNDQAELCSCLTWASGRPHRDMPPTSPRVLPPIRRRLHANYRLLPQHNVSRPPFRPMRHQQSLMEAQAALHNLLNCQPTIWRVLAAARRDAGVELLYFGIVVSGRSLRASTFAS